MLVRTKIKQMVFKLQTLVLLCLLFPLTRKANAALEIEKHDPIVDAYSLTSFPSLSSTHVG